VDDIGVLHRRHDVIEPHIRLDVGSFIRYESRDNCHEGKEIGKGIWDVKTESVVAIPIHRLNSRHLGVDVLAAVCARGSKVSFVASYLHFRGFSLKSSLLT
jgi:hypothetical protein